MCVGKELMPDLEKRFRAIGEPWARTLMGGSTGGWRSLAVQVFYPELFNGAWVFCPDPVDFRYFQLIDIYEDENACYPKSEWKKTPIGGHAAARGIPAGDEESPLRGNRGVRQARTTLLVRRSGRGELARPLHTGNGRPHHEHGTGGSGPQELEVLTGMGDRHLNLETAGNQVSARFGQFRGYGACPRNLIHSATPGWGRYGRRGRPEGSLPQHTRWPAERSRR